MQSISSPQGDVLVVVNSNEVKHGISPGLFGLFSSTHAAKEKLNSLAKQHRLCLQLLGSEKPAKRGCFGWQIKQCAGACVGQEPRSAHDQRLRDALQELQVHTWPFAGAVDLVEKRADWTQKHRISRWAYQGTWCSRQQSHEPVSSDNRGFDADTYQIIVKPVLLNLIEIELLPATN